MKITNAVPDDYPAIVELLKLSLGEEFLPKSEAFFRWKHEENPFGRSKILIAKEDDRIIGVRAFMRWRWQHADDEITAVRAVDTATDPDFQGRGIFRKLTTMAAEECKQEGVGFVFNTPNLNSMPGYLKMGWHTAGRMPVLIRPGSLVPKKFNESFVNSILAGYDVASQIEKLPESWLLKTKASTYITPMNKRYLQWRYSDCPIVQYGAVIENESFGFIFRVKKINRFTELRFCELWTEKKGSDAEARKAIKNIIRKIKPVLISCADSPLFQTNRKRPIGLYGPFKKGPLTTLRPLTKEKLNNFDGFIHWSPSLGNMELF